MTNDKLYTSLSANTIMAILTNHVQRTRLVTSSTDKHHSLDSEDDFRSGCWNVSRQQQFFSELHSPGRSHYSNVISFNLRNRPFARSGHMVQNHTCWWASCAVGLPKQCNSYQSTWTCLCFVSPTTQLAHQHVWFVPCDRIVQRAYFINFNQSKEPITINEKKFDQIEQFAVSVKRQIRSHSRRAKTSVNKSHDPLRRL